MRVPSSGFRVASRPDRLPPRLARATLLASALGAGLMACGGGAVDAAAGGTAGADTVTASDLGAVVPDVVVDSSIPVPDALACVADADCTGKVAIGPCQRASCAQGACVAARRGDGAACDDGDPCTTQTTCAGEACGGGKPVSCKDDNPCTVDACDPTTGCRFQPAPAGAACDDQDPCTLDDHCLADATCSGEPDAACACEADADCAIHEDDTLCNGTLACLGGRCTLDPATIVTCPPAGTCRVAACAPATGLCTTLLSAAGTTCDDGNPCTSDDACGEGVCLGQPGACPCAGPADCKAIQPAAYDLCLGPLVCLDGACAPDPDQAVTCAPGAPDACVTTACNPSTGLCGSVARPDGAACSGTDPCAPPGACHQGACQVAPASCDDGNPCTADTCDPASGCAHAPIAGPCNDGNPCTQGEQCTEAACGGGQGVVCDDLNPCTADKCVPGAGGCVAEPLADGIPCASGDPCVGPGACEAGACVGATSVTCEPAGPCATVACVPGKGCVATALADGMPCETNDPCLQTGTCQAGACQALPLPCGDGDPCTVDTCDALAGGCTHAPAADGTPCPSPDPCVEGASCYDGACTGGVPLSCPSDACADRACEPATGACVVVSAAPDGTPCDAPALCGAGGACKAGQCKGAGGPVCDDGDPCTKDACVAASATCAHVPVVCPQVSADPCTQAFCTVASGCLDAPNVACADATLLLATAFPCELDAAAWTSEGPPGAPVFGVDAAAPPPGAWGTGCSLNAQAQAALPDAPGVTWEAWAAGPALQLGAGDVPTLVHVDLVEWWGPSVAGAGLSRGVQLVGPGGTTLWAALGGDISPLDGGWTPRHVTFEVLKAGPWQLRLWLGGTGLPAPLGPGWYVDDLVVGRSL